MLYDIYMKKVADNCIEIDEINNIAYIKPDYKNILYSKALIPDIVYGRKITYDEVKEYLELMCKKINSKNDLSPALTSFFFEFITKKISPAIQKENNEFLANLIKYLELTKQEESNDKTEEIDSNIFTKIEIGDVVDL